MAKCDKCGKETGRLHYKDPESGWLCNDCLNFVPSGWTKQEKIKSRVVMPDGKVLEGRQAKPYRKEMLKINDKMRKHGKNTGADRK